MKKWITIFMLFFAVAINAQSLNDVKYIQVKRQYDFQDAPNQNRLSSMLKYHFEKLGYSVYYLEDGIPDEVRNSSCKQLKCEVERSGKMTVTELTVSLKDCTGNVVASGTGSSRLKDRKKTYPEVLTHIFDNTAVGKIQKK